MPLRAVERLWKRATPSNEQELSDARWRSFLLFFFRFCRCRVRIFKKGVRAVPVVVILPVAFSSHVGLKMHRRGSVDLSLYIDEEAADGCLSPISCDAGEGEDRQSDIEFIDDGIETGGRA